MDIKPKDDRERLITGVEAEEETVFNISLRPESLKNFRQNLYFIRPLALFLWWPLSKKTAIRRILSTLKQI